MKEVKTCQDCGMEFRSKAGCSRHKKVTYCDCETWKCHFSSRQAELKKW